LEQQHRVMLDDFHKTQNNQLDRIVSAQAAEAERLRSAVSEELRATRDAVNALQAKQDELRSEMLAKTLEKLGEQGRADQELIQTSFRNATQHLATSIETLSKTVDGRLEQIGGKVNERLDEGFKKTNETFVSVMARLATIDEAQKKIDGLTTNVVSLQELLGDKRSRGAFGEVQLEGLVRNILSPQAYEMQYTLPNGTRADCVLKLPEPTGMVAVDSKFPLENYHRMFDAPSAAEKLVAEKQFKADIKKHVDDISSKYIIADVTSDGAVMFIPAEAVFAEIHAHHSDVVDYAMQRRVWIVSPTTLMAVLNTARAVMKDVETRKQVHIIKDELGKLGKEFGRFDERMKKLADHIRQAHEDAQDVRTTSQKISKRFTSIEQVELDQAVPLATIATPESA
jgi:DNA recombination protein RmuC